MQGVEVEVRMQLVHQALEVQVVVEMLEHQLMELLVQLTQVAEEVVLLVLVLLVLVLVLLEVQV
jgi:hypothetical protein